MTQKQTPFFFVEMSGIINERKKMLPKQGEESTRAPSNKGKKARVLPHTRGRKHACSLKQGEESTRAPSNKGKKARVLIPYNVYNYDLVQL